MQSRSAMAKIPADPLAIASNDIDSGIASGQSASTPAPRRNLLPIIVISLGLTATAAWVILLLWLAGSFILSAWA